MMPMRLIGGTSLWKRVMIVHRENETTIGMPDAAQEMAKLMGQPSPRRETQKKTESGSDSSTQYVRLPKLLTERGIGFIRT